MVKLFKLTDENGRTYGGMQWGEGVTNRAEGAGKKLCSDGFIHAYESAWVAAFMNPIHANFRNPILWESEAEEVAERDGELKCGVKELTTWKQIPLPQLTTDQRVEIAIRLALRFYREKTFVTWAENWLFGKDKSVKAAWAAAAVRMAEWAAARAAEAAAEAAAEEVAEAAAWAAARAAEEVAEAAAWAAARAAEAAARAAAWAAAEPLNLASLIEEVVNGKVE